ncbi:hypothetical protein D3H55_12055 [Bacillus salacetis]|uniref:Uncharacterized protein n=1 Tax=Bacillus salacetis TaxID=2315464 RepID=A0A3A1QXA7_9BACI|nr:hypothetical protein [Bacillus salacetis]RIW33111.1 hypothetical protein D3H55_12055 [Bacillus salacetis]
MESKNDLLLLLTEIENQLNDLETKINVRVNEERTAVVAERKLRLARAEKRYTKAETRVLFKLSLYGEPHEKANHFNNLELSYKTT